MRGGRGDLPQVGRREGASRLPNLSEWSTIPLAIRAPRRADKFRQTRGLPMRAGPFVFCRAANRRHLA